MQLSVEGLCPWDWLYQVLQYLQEGPQPTQPPHLLLMLCNQFPK